MCRRNQLYGCCAAALGLGLILGNGLESGVLCLCLGLGLLVGAVSCFRQK